MTNLANLRAATAASNFGLCEILEELGKRSKKSQESAIKKKELNKLYPVNAIFLEGALKCLMTSFLEKNYDPDIKPTVEEFVAHCLESKNLKMKALFLVLYHFCMPSAVKRLALRLFRTDIADAGSALGRIIFVVLYYRV